MKTTEQAARDYGEVTEIFTGIPSKDVEEIFIKGAEFANRWINTKEELPDIKISSRYSDNVLLKTKIGLDIDIMIAYFDYVNSEWTDTSNGEIFKFNDECIIEWKLIKI